MVEESGLPPGMGAILSCHRLCVVLSSCRVQPLAWVLSFQLRVPTWLTIFFLSLVSALVIVFLFVLLCVICFCENV